MTPLYPAGVYAPLPRFSKKTQTNIAPSVTRNTASARCSRDTPIISVAWSSKGSLLFPCFGEPSPRYSARHVHSGSSHRFYALRCREPHLPLRAVAQAAGGSSIGWRAALSGGYLPCGARHLWLPRRESSPARARRCSRRTTRTSDASERSVRTRHGAFLPLAEAPSESRRPCRILVREAGS